MLVLTLLIYFLIFVGIGIYDFIYFTGNIKYIILSLDIIFGLLIMSSTIESYIKKELKTKNNLWKGDWDKQK